MVKEPKLPKELAAKLKGILNPSASKDFDIEDVHFNDSKVDKDDEDLDDSSDSDAGREHYVEVGKSRLRKDLSLHVADDPKYKGKSVSRASLYDYSEEEESDEDDEVDKDEEEEEEEEGDDDDDDNSVEDEEIPSDDEQGSEYGNDALEMPTARFCEEGDSVSDYGDNSEESDEDIDDSEGDSADNDGVDVSDEDGDTSQEEEEDDDSSSNSDDSDDSIDEDDEMENAAQEAINIAAELKQAKEDEKDLLTTLAKKATSDLTKGLHVKNQHSIWETAFDLRIRFQKLLTSVQPLPQKDTRFLEQNKEAVDKISNQLVDVIDNLLSTRQALWPEATKDNTEPPKKVAKRVRDETLDLDSVWEEISQVGESYSTYSKSTLEKWCNKVRMSDGALSSKKFKAIDQGIMHQIHAVLANSERLIRRSQMKRSAVPVIGQQLEASSATTHDPETYDDNDFYQQMLKEFIQSRMVDTDNVAELGGLRWEALTKNSSLRHHKSLDKKKNFANDKVLKFHVHDPLVSFMAPIPKATWHPEMIDELYSSLFQGSGQAEAPKETEEEPLDLDDGLRIFG